MIFEHQSYRTFLRASLADRSRKAKGYSLRAFALKLGISNAFLSQLLSGKKSLSMDQAFKIGLKLDLTNNEVQYLCLLAQIEDEPDTEYRQVLLGRLSSLNPKRESFDLSVDLFKIVSDWYHFALLELTQITGLTVTAKTAAAKLGISVKEAELAIERLLRLELLEKDKGKLKKSHGYVLTEAHVSNAACRIFYRQLLEKAMLSLNEQAPPERISSTDLFPIDSKLLPEIERLSREFSQAVLHVAEKSKVKDTVYAWAMHGFRVSEEK